MQVEIRLLSIFSRVRSFPNWFYTKTSIHFHVRRERSVRLATFTWWPMRISSGESFKRWLVKGSKARKGGKGSKGVKVSKVAKYPNGAKGSPLNPSPPLLLLPFAPLVLFGVKGARGWRRQMGGGAKGAKAIFRLGFWVPTTCDHKKFDYNM